MDKFGGNAFRFTPVSPERVEFYIEAIQVYSKVLSQSDPTLACYFGLLDQDIQRKMSARETR